MPFDGKPKFSSGKPKITPEGNLKRNNTGRKPFNQRRPKEASLGKQRRKTYLILHGLSKLYKDSEEPIIMNKNYPARRT